MDWDESKHPRDTDGKFTDGSTPAEYKRLQELGIETKKNNHINRIGKIVETSATLKVLKGRLKNLEFGISPNYEKHILRGHGNVYNEYKSYITQIINDPHYIFEGNKANRVVFIRRIDKQVEMILELSIDENKRNQIISMWMTTNKEIQNIEKKFKLLYKKK